MDSFSTVTTGVCAVSAAELVTYCDSSNRTQIREGLGRRDPVGLQLAGWELVGARRLKAKGPEGAGRLFAGW